MNSQLIRKLCVAAVLLIGNSGFASAQAIPEEYDVCNVSNIAVMFFNGVQTTPSQANRAMQELRLIHKDESDDGRNIQYEVMYNYSDGFEDFVETFEQRLMEQEGILQGRFELFFEALDGTGNWWEQIVSVSSASAGILGGYVDWYQAAAVNALTTLAANPATDVNSAEHRTRLNNRVLEGNSLVLVAHSQGNLFVNAAFNYAQSITPENAVKVVHIAPASPTLNGEHTLADLDLVINGLRVAGSVPGITTIIPGYLFRPAGLNGKTDFMGHGLIEIYINPALDIADRVKRHINTAINTVEAPNSSEASAGFFTATLTWDGSGDVDLHAFEPNGTHVFFGAKVGNTGFLDVDNTSGFGPEHYYASCDSRQLQVGRYRIRVANYSRAAGRQATVQISTSGDGVLGTETKTMGGSTGVDPVFQYFDVDVMLDEDTGIYSASLAM